MRRLIVSNMVSVDGRFAGSDGNIDWHTVDDSFNKYATDFLQNIDTIIFGRKTYQLFESYWPEVLRDPAIEKDDLVIAQAINDAHKVVFSKTLKETTWNNSTLCDDLTMECITELKQHPGKDIVIYGSGSIVQQLTDMELIDEFRLMISPTILGAGQTLFDQVAMQKLNLVSSQVFKSNGNVLLTYTPA